MITMEYKFSFNQENMDLEIELAQVQSELEATKSELKKEQKQVKKINNSLAELKKKYQESLRQAQQMTLALEKLNSIDRKLKYISTDQTKITPYICNTLYPELKAPSQIKEIFLTELFEGIANILTPVGAVHEETGYENQVDMLYVAAIAKYLQAKNIFEFGTYLGQTTYHLTFASADVSVTTLDLPPEGNPQAGQYLGHYFKNSDKEAFIQQILCNSYQFDPAPFKNQMDFIFVDGDHSFDGVKNDTEKAFEMLAPGGIIVWHDYAPKHPDIVKFFAEFTQERPLFHIKKTCLLVYLDGIDTLSFQPYERRVSKEWLKIANKKKLVNQDQNDEETIEN